MLYRLRQSVAYRYFQFRTRGLEATRPLTSDSSSRCEVHTMLGTSDVTMYILAIKSLLSYIPGLAVAVHSDGSLTDDDLDHIRQHVRGIRFILHHDADARAAERLRDSPFLAKWRAVDAAYRRLIDIELWRHSEQIIILDADVLANEVPHEVSEWIRSGTRPFLLGQPSNHPPAQQDTTVPEHVQALFLRNIDEISQRLDTQPLFVQGATAGFCGYFRELSLPRVEAALKVALARGMPMDQWGGDQCLIIYLLSTAGAERLPPGRYVNFEPSVRNAAKHASIIHFYGTHRFHGLVYPDLASATVRRLRRS